MAPTHEFLPHLGGSPGYGEDTFYRPPPGLDEFVLYLWRRRFPPDVDAVVQPTLPDGCIDILSLDGAPAWLMGPETVRADHVIPGGTEIAGVRLRPGVGARLFGSAAGELPNHQGLLSDLPGVPRNLRGSRHLGLACEGFRPLIGALGPLVDSARPDDGVAYGAAWLARHPSATVDALGARLGWSSREVFRRFSRALGFGPKAMQRILRFQRVLFLAHHRRGQATLSRLAAESGYADQAHMTREFRALAHTTPGQLLAGPHDVTVPLLFSRCV